MSTDASWTELAADLRRYLASRVAPADVDDLVQDVLAQVVAAESSLDRSRSLAPWAQRVARNAVIDRHRKRQPSPPPEPQPEHAESMTIAAQAEAQREMLGAWMRLAVERLPEPYREAVRRVDVLGQTQSQAAAALNVPYPTLKSRVQRGRTKLREAFFDCCDAQLDARGRPNDIFTRADDDCPCCE